MTFPKNKIIFFNFFEFNIFSKIFYLVLRISWTKFFFENLKKTCTRAEQSIPLNDLPPHLYFIFLKILILLKIFFSLKEISLTSFEFIQPFSNLKNSLFYLKFLFLNQKLIRQSFSVRLEIYKFLLLILLFYEMI